MENQPFLLSLGTIMTGRRGSILFPAWKGAAEKRAGNNGGARGLNAISLYHAFWRV